MTRRTRRARRRLRREDARREPLLLLADDRYPGESLEALARCLYRYRSELAPPALAGVLALTGAVLHSRFPHAAPFVAALAAVVAAGLSRPEIAPGLRRIERSYASPSRSRQGYGWPSPPPTDPARRRCPLSWSSARSSAGCLGGRTAAAGSKSASSERSKPGPTSPTPSGYPTPASSPLWSTCGAGGPGSACVAGRP
jgi:hypothetical protein